MLAVQRQICKFWTSDRAQTDFRSGVLVNFLRRTPSPSVRDNNPPTLYVLNATAVTKPHAIEHLAVDLVGYNVDIAIITETRLKKKHADHCFAVTLSVQRYPQ